MLICLLIVCPAKESGVLLGLRSMTPSNGSVYRTLWIAPENGVVKILAEGEDILLPRSTGFWKVGIERLMDEQWQEDFCWAVPAGEEPEIPNLTYDEGCEGSDWTTILFIGNDYISFDRESGGYCEGAAHPWAVNWLEVLSIDDLQEEKGCVPLSTCIGEDGNAALLSGAEQYREKLSEEDKDMLEEQPDDCSWGLIRRQGRWVLRGRLRYSCEAYRGHYADFDIPFSPPASLVSYDELHPSWETVKATVPGAVDAFSSPTKDLLVVMTKEELVVYPVTGDAIGASVLTLELNDNEAAVMIQWAEGKHVQRWTEEIRKYLGNN